MDLFQLIAIAVFLPLTIYLAIKRYDGPSFSPSLSGALQFFLWFYGAIAYLGFIGFVLWSSDLVGRLLMGLGFCVIIIVGLIRRHRIRHRSR
jgi:hypothetical protein